MDEARALLDELMGVSRDGEREEVSRKFSDPDVCKFYIQGFCFMEEFQRTKHHYGDCAQAHDEDCKAQWEALDDDEKAKYPYQRDLYEWLDKMVSDLKSKVRRNEERIKSAPEVPLISADQAVISEMEEKIKDLQRQSVELGEQGDIDAAHAATTQADKFKAERDEFEREAKQKALEQVNRYGEQEVCQFSGVIINAEESRLRDHKAGKNYRAWVHVHEKKKELEDTFKRRGVSMGTSSRPDRDRDRDRDREKERDRERDREGDRDRLREKERDRERDRAREKDRERYRERRRSRSREHRSSDRHRDSRVRDGDRRRERERSSRHRDRSAEDRHRRRSRSQLEQNGDLELPPPPALT